MKKFNDENTFFIGVPYTMEEFLFENDKKNS